MLRVSAPDAIQVTSSARAQRSTDEEKRYPSGHRYSRDSKSLDPAGFSLHSQNFWQSDLYSTIPGSEQAYGLPGLGEYPSSAVSGVVLAAGVGAAVVVVVVVVDGGGWVDVMTGRGPLHPGTAQGQLHTSRLLSNTVPAGHSNMYC